MQVVFLDSLGPRCMCSARRDLFLAAVERRHVVQREPVAIDALVLVARAGDA